MGAADEEKSNKAIATAQAMTSWLARVAIATLLLLQGTSRCFFLHQLLPYWWRLLSPTSRQPTGRSLLFLVLKTEADLGGGGGGGGE